jgi:hypothetical protein
VDVAHFERRALAVQTRRSEGRETTLVGELRQRVRLVDDLRQFAASEEVIDRRRNGLRVDDLPGRKPLLLHVELLLRGLTQLEEALADFFRGEFRDRADAAVAEVVDIVHLEARLVRAQREDVLDHVDEVVRRERHLVVGHRLAETRLARSSGDRVDELAIQTEATDLAEAVTRLVAELLVEQLARLLERRRIARTELLIDPDERVVVGLRGVFAKRVEEQEILGLPFDDLDFLQPRRTEKRQVFVPSADHPR